MQVKKKEEEEVLGVYRKVGEVVGLPQARIPKMGISTNIPVDPWVCTAFPAEGGEPWGSTTFVLHTMNT